MELYGSFKSDFIEDLYLMEKNESDLDSEFLKFSYDISNFFQDFIHENKICLKSEKGKENLKILKVLKGNYNN
jgi:hypothetical protein